MTVLLVMTGLVLIACWGGGTGSHPGAIPAGSRRATGDGYDADHTNEAIAFLHAQGLGWIPDLGRPISFVHLDDFANGNAIYMVDFGVVPPYGRLVVYDDRLGMRIISDYQIRQVQKLEEMLVSDEDAKAPSADGVRPSAGP